MPTDTLPTDTAREFREIPLVDLVESKLNPRKRYDQAQLDELIASVRSKGVIEPILVRPLATPVNERRRCEILAGSRRYRAAKAAGLETLPCVVRHGLSDEDALELALIENIMRADLSPLEEARTFETWVKKLNHTPASIGAKVDKSESFVYRRLRLLDLEDWLQDALDEGRLSLAHAEKLLRLDSKRRATAADPQTGVVWRYSPLLAAGEKWVPQFDDLRPLAELEQFILTKSHFDPKAPEAVHLQPGLAEQLEAAIDEEFTDTTDTPEAVEAFTSSLIELSVDPMVRMRLDAKPDEKIPLSPSKWREITSPAGRCNHARRGVVTHGGPYRVLEVCITRSCVKHFGKPKPKGRASKASAAAEDRQRKAQEDDRRKREKEEADRAAWEAVIPRVCQAFAKHIAGVKFSVALVRAVLDTHELQRVEKTFGVALSPKTAAQVLALSAVTVSSYWRSDTENSMKAFGFDVKACVRQLEAEDAKRATPAKKAPAPAKGSKAKAAAPAAKRKGGK